MASFIVPARFASLKSLLCLPHCNANNVGLRYAISSRSNPCISSYFFRVGSSLIPSKSVYLEQSGIVSGGSECFMECQKAFHSLNNAENASSLSNSVFNSRDAVLAGTSWVAMNSDDGAHVVATAGALSNGKTSLNGFAIHLELESFACRTDTLISGLNTLASNIFFEYNCNTGATSSYTLDFYANYDHILCLQDGLLSVRF
jgi:hypothetical protein